jgi:shikimate dehydrogenase
MAPHAPFPEDGRDRYALIGHPVARSLSPLMQRAAFDAAGVPAVYVALDVPPESLPDLRPRLEGERVRGFNVTAPHKVAVRDHLDAEDPIAREAGSVNTVRCGTSGWEGFNTDVEGFSSALAEAWGRVEGRRVLVLGSGGAAAAAVAALAREGAGSIEVRCRRPGAAERLRALGPDVRPGRLDDRPAAADLVVNALPPFDLPSGEPLVGLDPDRLPPGTFVFDLNYPPPVPPFLAACRRRGLAGADGLGMLLHQGAAAFHLWTERPAPRSAMRRVLEEAVSRS